MSEDTTLPYQEQIHFNNLHLQDKTLLSKAFEAFNTSIQKLREYQARLEEEVQTLHSELHIKNQELTNILESLSHGLIVTDLSGRVSSFNREATTITGLVAEKVGGKQVNELFQYPVLPKNLNKEGIKAVESNFHQRFIQKNQEGKETILDTTTTLMLSDKGEKLGIIINLNDVTQLVHLEKEAARKNRLTAMGRIAANVAHEIRNPLGGIEIFLSMLKIDLAEDEEKMKMIHHITSGVKSMNHIISNLLEYTKPRPIQSIPINIEELISEFIDFSHHVAKHQSVQIKNEFKAKESYILGDKEFMKQIFHNLFVNAIQAMQEGGTLTTTLQNKEKKLQIIFADTGKGMNKQVKKKLFDPFFTTKNLGTGLGMSIVKNIVESHNGNIFVESVINQGTKIILEFPIHSFQ